MLRPHRRSHFWTSNTCLSGCRCGFLRELAKAKLSFYTLERREEWAEEVKMANVFWENFLYRSLAWRKFRFLLQLLVSREKKIPLGKRSSPYRKIYSSGTPNVVKMFSALAGAAYTNCVWKFAACAEGSCKIYWGTSRRIADDQRFCVNFAKAWQTVFWERLSLYCKKSCVEGGIVVSRALRQLCRQ